MTTTQVRRRRLEDSLAETYQNTYGTGSYAFGTAGGDSGCWLEWSFGGNIGKPVWTYYCLNGPTFMSETDEGIQYRHIQTCTGYQDDFDNFACALSVTTFDEVSQRIDILLQVNLDCFSSTASGNNDTGSSGLSCTCSEASLLDESCSVCHTCASSSFEDFLQNFTIQSDLSNVALTCPADSVCSLADFGGQKSCPVTAIITGGHLVEQKWIWIIVGMLVVARLVGVLFERLAASSRKR